MNPIFHTLGDEFRELIVILFIVLFASLPLNSGKSGNIEIESKWDANLLEARLGHVDIKADNARQAWQEISESYLLRGNCYMVGDEANIFSISSGDVVSRQLVEAFLAAYPTYSYDCDSNTGVMWIHPKSIKYVDVLNQKIRIVYETHQIQVLNSVLMPLSKLLSPEIMMRRQPSLKINGISMGPGPSFNYAVDLPAGVYSFKDILNLCCAANPSKAFTFLASGEGSVMLVLSDLSQGNPLAPPRATAVKFWEIEVGNPTNEIPNAAEVSKAMSDMNPRKRWAARCYLEAASRNYSWTNLIAKSDGPEGAVWTALGIEAATYRGINDPQFLLYVTPGFTNKLMQIKDPCLALVTSLELTREKQDTSYLDDIVSKHKFTEAEIGSIKPDIYRLAHESSSALNKLKSMKLDLLEFSPEALRELEYTNLFTLVSGVEK